MTLGNGDAKTCMMMRKTEHLNADTELNLAMYVLVGKQNINSLIECNHITIEMLVNIIVQYINGYYNQYIENEHFKLYARSLNTGPYLEYSGIIDLVKLKLIAFINEMPNKRKVEFFLLINSLPQESSTKIRDVIESLFVEKL